MQDPFPQHRAPRIALLHHWLDGMRGGEKVLEALCDLAPGADIYTIACIPAAISAKLRQHRIHTSLIQRLPFGRRHFRQYLALFPMAVEQFDFSGYDLLISSDACVVKGALTAPDTPHICYCHSPPRYVWDQYALYRAGAGPIARWLMPPVMHYLRWADHAAAQRVDRFVANSQAVAARIRRHYRRPAEVIHPPVDTDYFGQVRRAPGDAYLFAGQLVGYKRADLAVAACARLRRRLVVVGDGPERRRLEQSAPSNVQFVGRVSDGQLRDYYAMCRALLHPGEEDFGIMAVEAQAAGAPVIALARGGALDSVVDGQTGVLFNQPTVEGLIEAIRRYEAMDEPTAERACRAQAECFDRSVFLARMRALIDDVLAGQPAHAPDTSSIGNAGASAALGAAVEDARS